MHEDSTIRRRLKLRQFETLLAIAQTGSMAKAAERLAVTQPAVSKAIADLEHALGVRLLDRTAQGVEPNLYGEALLRSARAVFDEVRQGIKEIEFLANPTTGDLRIGATSTIIAGILPHILDRIHSEFPQIRIHITQIISQTQQWRDLRERVVDLIVARLPTPIDDDVRAEFLYDEQIFVVAGATSRWSRRRKIGLAELVDEPWVLPDLDSGIGAVVAEAFCLNGVDVPRRAVTTLAFQLNTALVATGRYLSIVPASVLRFSPDHRVLKPLPVRLGVPPSPIAIMSLKNRTMAPVGQVFMNHAREVVRPLAQRHSANR